MSKATEILSNKSLRITPCRIFVLNEFLKKKTGSFSELDLEKKAKGNFDRVTIYRTLKTFIESDILHRILDDHPQIKYAFCRDHEHEEHNHEHVHFKCNKCETTQCLEDVTPSELSLPKGFLKTEVNYLVIGICPTCNI